MLTYGAISVMTYGATGNGVTDDSAAFQAALTALVGTGVELFIPTGTYLINTAPTWDSRTFLVYGAGATFTGTGSTGLAAHYQPAEMVANYWIDPVSGNNANDGQAVGRPLKSFTELISRWGTQSPMLPQTTTINVLSSQPLNAEHIVLKPTMVGGSNFIILGTNAAVAGGPSVLGTVTAKNKATPQRLKSTGFSAAGLAVGQLVVNTTRANSRAFIDVLAAGVATFTQPLAAEGAVAAGAAAPAEVDTWATGDSIVVYNLPKLNLAVLAPMGGESDVATGSTPISWVQNIYIPDDGGTAGFSTFASLYPGGGAYFVDCAIEPFIGGDGSNSGWSINFHNVWGAGGGNFRQCFFIGGALATVSGYPCSLYSLTTLDNGVVAAGNLLVRDSNVSFGDVYEAGTITVEPSAGVTIAAVNSVATLWGPGTINAVANAAVVVTGTTFALALLIANLKIDGATTATKYVTGTFTGSVALTAANMDSFGGLQNPLTGARYTLL